MIKRELELKVGIFVLIGVVILSLFIFSIGDFYFFEQGYRIKIVFGFVSGIEEGVPVRFAGVKVGEVKQIEIFYDEAEQKPKVALKLWIKGGTAIRENARAYISTLGLIGEKYLEVLPGPGKDAKFLKDGDVLAGVDPVPIEKLMQVHKVVDQLTKATESLNKILSDKETISAFRETVKNSQQVSENLKALTDSANIIVDRLKEGEGTVGKLLCDEELYRDIHELVKDIKKHPWKLLRRSGVADKPEDVDTHPTEGNKGYLFRK